jgi:hypothetical protein
MASRKLKASAIPVGTGFSPIIINLAQFIRGLVVDGGDKKALMTAVHPPREADPTQEREEAHRTIRRPHSGSRLSIRLSR